MNVSPIEQFYVAHQELLIFEISRYLATIIKANCLKSLMNGNGL